MYFSKSYKDLKKKLFKFLNIISHERVEKKNLKKIEEPFFTECKKIAKFQPNQKSHL
jgi:hypothetical protein